MVKLKYVMLLVDIRSFSTNRKYILEQSRVTLKAKSGPTSIPMISDVENRYFTDNYFGGEWRYLALIIPHLLQPFL